MLNGAILIGAEERQSSDKFHGVNPSTGQRIEQPFSAAAEQDVADAAALAESAFPAYAALEPEMRARFLDSIADHILAIGDDLIVTAMAETGLPRGRLEGERGRTAGQLRMFAALLRQGEWLDVTIDPAMPHRVPPRSDLRRLNVAVGPVAVFGASNFPLAFSVAGGDTASALAAGCPVIVKGHPAHPGTGEFVARAIRAAAAACDLPAGVFSFLPGHTNALGAALVADPRIKAVGFTGSRAGGLALVEIASKRKEPIPVYAEMSSINPVFLLPAALRQGADDIAKAFVQSLTLGAGQFCTNPGVVVALNCEDLDRFLVAAESALSDSAPAVMLTPNIYASFEQGVESLAAHRSVSVVRNARVGEGVNQAWGALFATDAAAFLADESLSHEIFGSSSIVVRCANVEEMIRVARALEGQLTATLHVGNGDEGAAARLMPALQEKAGRILANGWPTGVEVTHAMVHGGPFPATSDGRTTSVGTLAITRFLRPVCYQDIPDDILPPPLQDANPWKLPRRIDGKLELVR